MKFNYFLNKNIKHEMFLEVQVINSNFAEVKIKINFD